MDIKDINDINKFNIEKQEGFIKSNKLKAKASIDSGDMQEAISCLVDIEYRKGLISGYESNIRPVKK